MTKNVDKVIELSETISEALGKATAAAVSRDSKNLRDRRRRL